MPVNEDTTLNITCDNPNCPGNSLDATERTGWTFVTTEVYGEPTQSNVFCCYGCVSATASTADAGEGPMARKQEEVTV